MKTLITAFTPFNEHEENISQLVVENLDGVNKLILPTSYEKAFTLLLNHLLKNTYDYILLTGEARKRDCITLEYFAQNLDHASIPDICGVKKELSNIIDHAPLTLKTTFSDLELERLISPETKLSFHAGNYVCNSTYFKLLNYLLENNLNTKALFIHLPNREILYLKRKLMKLIKEIETR